jgi:hypothetical protein
MIKKILFLSVMLFCIQKGEAQFTLPSPSGWTDGGSKSTIKRVPNIPEPYKGVQAYRFPPNYLNTGSDQYASFVILWFIDGKASFNTHTLADDLEAYFTDLHRFDSRVPYGQYKVAEANYKGVAKFELKPGRRNENEQYYEGTILNLNYLNGENETYQARVHIIGYDYGGVNSHTAVLIEVSMVSYSDPVWTELDAIVAGFKISNQQLPK